MTKLERGTGSLVSEAPSSVSRSTTARERRRGTDKADENKGNSERHLRYTSACVVDWSVLVIML